MFWNRNGKSAAEEKTDTQMGQALGWASIGIGLAEIAAPRQVQAMLGIEDTPQNRGILRTLGVRELGHGIALLSEDRPTKEMAASAWARVAGDALDTALLGIAATKTRRPISFAVLATMVAGIGIADMVCAKRLSEYQA